MALQKTKLFPADSQLITDSDGTKHVITVDDAINEYMDDEGKGWQIVKMTHVAYKNQRIQIDRLGNFNIVEVTENWNDVLVLLEAPDLRIRN